jgi:replication factor C small subunit
MLLEKYPVTNLNHVVGQQHVISFLKRRLLTKDIPHLGFIGKPGTGKTTTAICLANELYGEDAADYNFRFYEAATLNKEETCGRLDSWLTHGLSIMLHDITGLRVNLPIPSYKLCVIDECEKLSSIVETLLRKRMEQLALVRFVLIWNDPTHPNITPPLHSRLKKFTFLPLPPQDMIQRINYIIAQEKGPAGVQQLSQQVNQIVLTHRGDLRGAINDLEEYV